MSNMESETAASDQQGLPPLDAVDWLLQDLVRWANVLDDATNDGVGIPVTVLVSAGSVSGNAIGARRFFREYAAQWKKGFSGPGAESSEAGIQIEKHYLDMSQQVYGSDEAPAEGKQIGYIHISEAKLFMPGSGSTINLGLWRGQLRLVTGFTFGRLEVTK